MELITNILIEYLKHNKRIVVPKLGAFIVKQPSGIVRFSDLMRNDDGVLRSLLVAYGMSELEANGMIDRFVFEVRHAIGQGENYTLDSFGEFRSGDNNTISFIHKLEPRVVGGNIKPPVEILNIEKQKLQLTSTTTEERMVQKTKSKKDKADKSDDNTLTLNKPDAYLRGLNYDDRKKKHSDERKDKRKTSRGISPILLFFLLILIIGGGYGGWIFISSNRTAPTVEFEKQIIEDVAPIVIDSLMEMTEIPSDSLTLSIDNVIENLNTTIDNTVTE